MGTVQCQSSIYTLLRNLLLNKWVVYSNVGEKSLFFARRCDVWMVHTLCVPHIFIERRVRRKSAVKRAVPDGSYLKAAWRLLAVDRLYSPISSLNIEENMSRVIVVVDPADVMVVILKLFWDLSLLTKRGFYF